MSQVALVVDGRIQLICIRFHKLEDLFGQERLGRPKKGLRLKEHGTATAENFWVFYPTIQENLVFPW